MIRFISLSSIASLQVDFFLCVVCVSHHSFVHTHTHTHTRIPDNKKEQTWMATKWQQFIVIQQTRLLFQNSIKYWIFHYFQGLSYDISANLWVNIPDIDWTNRSKSNYRLAKWVKIDWPEWKWCHELQYKYPLILARIFIRITPDVPMHNNVLRAIHFRLRVIISMISKWHYIPSERLRQLSCREGYFAVFVRLEWHLYLSSIVLLIR